MAKVGVIGSGTWGTALALLLHRNGHEVTVGRGRRGGGRGGLLLHRNGHEVTVGSVVEREIAMLRDRHEHVNLPGTEIPEDITFTTSLEKAVRDMEAVVLTVASPYTRQTAAMLRDYIAPGQIIVNGAKGIEEHTLMTLSEIIEEEIPQADVAVLSGPSHAEEVGRGIPTTIVVGAKTQKTADFIQNLFMNEVFRVYTCPDMLGMELGGSLKNVVALAAGIADGLGYGDNTKAALITRGIAEIARLGTAMGGKFETFCGLTGIGDLIVTCASMHSRNRRAGILIGQGYSMDEAMKEVQMVVEGVYSAKAAMELAEKYDVQLPIIEQVNAVLFENKPADQAVKDLMLRDKKIESSQIPWE